MISVLLSYFNEDYVLNILDNWNITIEPLYKLYLDVSNIEIKRKILNNFNLDLTRYDLLYFFSITKESSLASQKNHEVEGLNIPRNLITKDVLHKLTSKYDIFRIRKILKDAAYVVDTTDMERYVSVYEDNYINEYNSQMAENIVIFHKSSMIEL